MITNSITGSSLLINSEQTRQVLSAAMMKQSATQQDKIANILVQNALQASQPAAKSGSSFNFSTYV